ncbi:MAG TPA: hypothetical protein VK506_12660 [Conexibacter sp.]|nr:hypothetical protein [Conexibacter sp.]
MTVADGSSELSTAQAPEHPVPTLWVLIPVTFAIVAFGVATWLFIGSHLRAR